MAPQRLALLVAFTCILALLANARQSPFETHQDLLARLDSGTGSYSDCLSALLELRSCTSEIVLFFLNGETYLGTDCCRAIHVIARQCWPSMLTSIGFTAEEGDILIGYCDASAATPPPPPAALGPVAAGGPSKSQESGLAAVGVAGLKA